MWSAAAGRRHFVEENSWETAASHFVKLGFVGIPLSRSSDANSTQEVNKYVLGELRPRKSEMELAALYRRRDAVVSLIRSLERYRRAKAGHIPGCSRRASRAA